MPKVISMKKGVCEVMKPGREVDFVVSRRGIMAAASATLEFLSREEFQNEEFRREVRDFEDRIKPVVNGQKFEVLLYVVFGLFLELVAPGLAEAGQLFLVVEEGEDEDNGE